MSTPFQIGSLNDPPPPNLIPENTSDLPNVEHEQQVKDTQYHNLLSSLEDAEDSKKQAIWGLAGSGGLGILMKAFQTEFKNSDPTQSLAYRVGWSAARSFIPGAGAISDMINKGVNAYQIAKNSKQLVDTVTSTSAFPSAIASLRSFVPKDKQNTVRTLASMLSAMDGKEIGSQQSPKQEMRAALARGIRTGMVSSLLDNTSAEKSALLQKYLPALKLDDMNMVGNIGLLAHSKSSRAALQDYLETAHVVQTNNQLLDLIRTSQNLDDDRSQRTNTPNDGMYTTHLLLSLAGDKDMLSATNPQDRNAALSRARNRVLSYQSNEDNLAINPGSSDRMARISTTGLKAQLADVLQDRASMASYDPSSSVSTSNLMNGLMKAYTDGGFRINVDTLTDDNKMRMPANLPRSDTDPAQAMAYLEQHGDPAVVKFVKKLQDASNSLSGDDSAEHRQAIVSKAKLGALDLATSLIPSSNTEGRVTAKTLRTAFKLAEKAYDMKASDFSSDTLSSKEPSFKNIASSAADYAKEAGADGLLGAMDGLLGRKVRTSDLQDALTSVKSDMMEAHRSVRGLAESAQESVSNFTSHLHSEGRNLLGDIKDTFSSLMTRFRKRKVEEDVSSIHTAHSDEHERRSLSSIHTEDLDGHDEKSLSSIHTDDLDTKSLSSVRTDDVPDSRSLQPPATIFGDETHSILGDLGLPDYDYLMGSDSAPVHDESSLFGDTRKSETTSLRTDSPVPLPESAHEDKNDDNSTIIRAEHVQPSEEDLEDKLVPVPVRKSMKREGDDITQPSRPFPSRPRYTENPYAGTEMLRIAGDRFKPKEDDTNTTEPIKRDVSHTIVEPNQSDTLSNIDARSVATSANNTHETDLTLSAFPDHPPSESIVDEPAKVADMRSTSNDDDMADIIAEALPSTKSDHTDELDRVSNVHDESKEPLDSFVAPPSHAHEAAETKEQDTPTISSHAGPLARTSLFEGARSLASNVVESARRRVFDPARSLISRLLTPMEKAPKFFDPSHMDSINSSSSDYVKPGPDYENPSNSNLAPNQHIASESIPLSTFVGPIGAPALPTSSAIPPADHASDFSSDDAPFAQPGVTEMTDFSQATNNSLASAPTNTTSNTSQPVVSTDDTTDDQSTD